MLRHPGGHQSCGCAKSPAGSKPGFRNWIPKVGNCKILRHPIFNGRPQYTPISTIKMYLVIRIKNDIHIQHHGNYIELRYSIICLKLTFQEISHKELFTFQEIPHKKGVLKGGF